MVRNPVRTIYGLLLDENLLVKRGKKVQCFHWRVGLSYVGLSRTVQHEMFEMNILWGYYKLSAAYSLKLVGH